MIINKTPRNEIITNVVKYFIKKFLFIFIKKNLQHHPPLAIYSSDFIGLNISIDGLYEKKQLNIVDAWIEKYHKDAYKGVCLDVGANIGNHSLFYSKKFDQVFSFEVLPKNFKLLKINTENSKNIKIFDFGLSSKSHNIDFYYFDSNLGGTSKINIENQNTKKLNLPVKKLDDLAFDKYKISFIKLDVEGSELDVIRGGSKFFQSNSPIIVFEQQPEDFNENSSELIDELKSLGYSKFYTTKNYPNILKSKNIFSKIFNLITLILLGQKMIIYEVKEFKKDFYHMIIAIK